MKKPFNKLYTLAGERLKNDPSIIPWDVYPRPHLRRKEWLNLNGFWDMETESGYRGSIRVPFCVESLLSGVSMENDIGRVSYGEKLIYRRSFDIPEEWRGKRIILNFGSPSRSCRVYVNGSMEGWNHSAYIPGPACDITDCLRDGENELVIECVNDLDPAYPYGKQRIDRGGMWYTPCSGIWQTVWLEPVPEEHIRELVVKQEGMEQVVYVTGPKEGVVYCEGRRFGFKKGVCRMSFSKPRLWSPEEPNLYEFTVKAGEDEAESYFAFRTVETKVVNGVPRLCLNGKPYFFNGLLDQGYFSDGLWTPAEPQEYERDILKMKSLGFNMLRKHIKIEPELFYYYCDKLGMAVFQDMVNNGRYRFLRDTLLPTIGVTKLCDKRLNKDAAARGNFAREMLSTARLLGSHPSIVYWTIFNEGWGQFCADEMYERLKKLDPTRPIDSASGWFHQHKTDVDSLHIYFKKLRLGKRRLLPQVISEFGGYVWKDEAHSFNPNKTYGYKIFKTREEFVSGFKKLYLEELLPLVKQGLSAAVYTQVSDVEDETNGLMTYDRRVMKLSAEDAAKISEALKKACE
ncbi:MAG: glycoside hydrolase family 2 [Clostridia bacterium]|nr:glycoside hydrolase family 2 [Clostridia bacterium]